MWATQFRGSLRTPLPGRRQETRNKERERNPSLLLSRGTSERDLMWVLADEATLEEGEP